MLANWIANATYNDFAEGFSSYQGVIMVTIDHSSIILSCFCPYVSFGQAKMPQLKIAHSCSFCTEANNFKMMYTLTPNYFQGNCKVQFHERLCAISITWLHDTTRSAPKTYHMNLLIEVFQLDYHTSSNLD